MEGSVDSVATPKSPPRRLMLRESIAVACLGVAGAFFLLLFPGATTPAERLYEWDTNRNLPDSPHPPTLIVRGDRYYWWRPTQGEGNDRWILYTMPLHGGKYVALHEREATFASDNMLITRDGKSLIYLNKGANRLKLEAFAGAGGMAPGDAHPAIAPTGSPIESGDESLITYQGKKYVINGSYRYDGNSKDIVGRTVLVRPRSLKQAASPIYLVTVSLDAGTKPTVREIPLSFDGYSSRSISYVLTSAGVYWLLPGAETERVIIDTPQTSRREGGFHVEVAPQDTLMWTDLDGKNRILQEKCLYRFAGVEENRLKLVEIGAYGSPEVREFRLPIGAVTRPELISERKSARLPNSWLTVNDRDYWLEGNAITGDQRLASLPLTSDTMFDPRTPVTLMSAKRDGSDRRALLTLEDEDKNPLTPLSLFKTDDALFLVYRRSAPGGGTIPQNYLVRINMAQEKAAFGKPIRLPDGDSLQTFREPEQDRQLYFLTTTIQKDVLDVFQQDSREQALCRLWRVRLPEK